MMIRILTQFFSARDQPQRKLFDTPTKQFLLLNLSSESDDAKEEMVFYFLIKRNLHHLISIFYRREKCVDHLILQLMSDTDFFNYFLISRNQFSEIYGMI